MNALSMSFELRKLTDKLRGNDFEKTIPYLYLDSVGILTIGVGHNLKDNPVPSPLSLSFRVARLERHTVAGGDRGIPITQNPVLGRAATPDEIKNDIDFLTRYSGLKKYAPENLAKYTTLELSTGEIDTLFEADRLKFFRECRKEFGSETYLSFPVPCQAALLDIAFNCGSFKDFRGHFVPAIKGTGIYAGKSWAERWTIAAEYSRRGTVGLTRNAIVKGWLLEGAKLSATPQKAAS